MRQIPDFLQCDQLRRGREAAGKRGHAVPLAASSTPVFVQGAYMKPQQLAALVESIRLHSYDLSTKFVIPETMDPGRDRGLHVAGASAQKAGGQ